MAGEFPVPVRTSGRKQWKIFNGPRGPIRRLGNQLAEDGCPDSQVVLAKQLLEEKCGNDVDQEENARLGVYWLIKASEQGHEEATQILQHCLATGQGINEQNIADVRTCLDMSQEEKVSRLAARELFASLSQGEDFITSEQLSEEMLRAQDKKQRSGEMSGGTDEQQNIENNWKDRIQSGNSEKLTEDILVTAASHYARGELPLVHRVLALDKARDSGSKPYLHSFLFSPFQTIRSSYSWLVDSIGSRPIRSFFPFTLANLQTLLIFTLFALFGLDGLVEALPTFLYFSTLAVMIISTCQILAKKWEFNHFKKWSNLLVAWGGNGVNPQDAQWAYCANNIRPCFVFLVAIFGNLTITPFVPLYNIPHSEIVVVSTLCALVTLYNFSWLEGKIDSLVLFSFGVHLLARYPYETDAVVSQGWRFLDVHVPTFASYVVGSGVEFCLNFRVIFYLLMPAILVKMAARDRWRGFYTSFVPHCVVLAWWQMAVISSTGATWYGLIRSCLALVGLVLFLPLAGLATVFLPVAAVAKFLTEERLFPLSATVGLASASLLTMLYVGKKRPSAGRIVSWVQIGLGLLSGVLLLAPLISPPPEAVFSRSTPLTWTQYQRHCAPPPSVELKVPYQEKCATLAGLYVYWEGRVVSSSISKIYNPMAVVISKLPVSMQEVASCMYGEPHEDCSDKEGCSAPPGLQKKCHLSNWNRYEYEIMVSMSSGGWREDCQASLMADTIFRNFTVALVPGDRIWFSGVLIGNKSGVLDPVRPKLRLHQSGCLSCTGPKLPPATVNSISSFYSLGDLYVGIKSVLNFVLNPLVIFK